MSEPKWTEPIMDLSCYLGSSIVATCSSNIGKNENDAANLSILLSLQKISTGKDIFNTPFPERIFFPILLIIYVRTFFCSFIFS
jgi:hypothetical protein